MTYGEAVFDFMEAVFDFMNDKADTCNRPVFQPGDLVVANNYDRVAVWKSIYLVDNIGFIHDNDLCVVTGWSVFIQASSLIELVPVMTRIGIGWVSRACLTKCQC